MPISLRQQPGQRKRQEQPQEQRQQQHRHSNYQAPPAFMHFLTTPPSGGGDESTTATAVAKRLVALYRHNRVLFKELEDFLQAINQRGNNHNQVLQEQVLSAFWAGCRRPKLTPSSCSSAACVRGSSNHPPLRIYTKAAVHLHPDKCAPLGLVKDDCDRLFKILATARDAYKKVRGLD